MYRGNYLKGVGKKVLSLKKEGYLFHKTVIAERGKDISVSADKRINRSLIKFIKHETPYEVISEESQTEKSFDSIDDPVWIIDPLDGSLNFARNIPISCISIALWKKQQPLGGVIFDFVHQRLFSADLDSGTLPRENDMVIRTSRISEINRSVLCTGFPSWRDYKTKSLSLFVERIQKWKKIRLIGSAALSLAWVASGRADAYIEEDIRIWDVAAGLALVKAAGGHIYCKPGSRKNFVTAAATNGKIPIEALIS